LAGHDQIDPLVASIGEGLDGQGRWDDRIGADLALEHHRLALESVAPARHERAIPLDDERVQFESRRQSAAAVELIDDAQVVLAQCPRRANAQRVLDR
jgi:hypothetical protein